MHREWGAWIKTLSCIEVTKLPLYTHCPNTSIFQGTELMKLRVLSSSHYHWVIMYILYLSLSLSLSWDKNDMKCIFRQNEPRLHEGRVLGDIFEGNDAIIGIDIFQKGTLLFPHFWMEKWCRFSKDAAEGLFLSFCEMQICHPLCWKVQKNKNLTLSCCRMQTCMSPWKNVLVCIVCMCVCVSTLFVFNTLISAL